MKTYAAITPDQKASDAFAAILSHILNNLDTWQDKARTWDDIEGVHHIRVTFRSLRSAFSVFRPVLDRKTRKRWSNIIKDLVEQTGMARDLDVLINEGMPAFHEDNFDLEIAGKMKLDEVLTDKRSEAYDRVRLMLDSDAYRDFKTDIAKWIENAGWYTDDLSKKKRKRLGKPVDILARRILSKQDHLIRGMGDKIHIEDSTGMHRLRIECKKLRYANEFFFPLFQDMNAFLKNMKSIQDILGVMHDAAVLPGLMEQIIPKAQDPTLMTYVEVLIDWRTEQYRVKSINFKHKWLNFVGAQRPWCLDDRCSVSKV